MKWSPQAKIGISLVIVGLSPFICTEYWSLSRNWTPVDAAVVLKPGEFRSAWFKTDLDGRYLLSVAADQLSGFDLDREQCMMGVDFPRTVLNCDGIPQTVEFDWQVVSKKGEVMKSGSYSALSISGAQIVFGEFHGYRN